MARTAKYRGVADLLREDRVQLEGEDREARAQADGDRRDRPPGLHLPSLRDVAHDVFAREGLMVRRTTAEERALMARMYRAGACVTEIGLAMGFTGMAVWDCLKKEGVPTRRRGPRPGKAKCRGATAFLPAPMPVIDENGMVWVDYDDVPMGVSL